MMFPTSHRALVAMDSTACVMFTSGRGDTAVPLGGGDESGCIICDRAGHAARLATLDLFWSYMTSYDVASVVHPALGDDGLVLSKEMADVFHAEVLPRLSPLVGRCRLTR